MIKSKLSFSETVFEWIIIIMLLFFITVFICGCTQDPMEKQTTSLNNSENGTVFYDVLGNRIELSYPASRIIACTHDNVEMLITLDAAEKIVGVAGKETFNKPYLMEKLPLDVKDIGSYAPLNIEATIQLNPDAIVSYGSDLPTNLDKIQALNLTMVYADCYRLEGLNNDAYVLGKLTGNNEEALRYIRFNQKYLALVESRLENITPNEIPTVYIESSDYTAMTKTGYLGQIVNTLHASNAYDDQNPPFEAVKVDAEWILHKNPDIIIKMGYMTEPYVSVCNEIASRTGFERVKAAQSDNIYLVNSHMAGGPRAVIALVYLAKAIYPDRFADINPDAVRREYAELFGFGDEEGVEWFYPPFEPVNEKSAGGQ